MYCIIHLVTVWTVVFSHKFYIRFGLFFFHYHEAQTVIRTSNNDYFFNRFKCVVSRCKLWTDYCLITYITMTYCSLINELFISERALERQRIIINLTIYKTSPATRLRACLLCSNCYCIIILFRHKIYESVFHISQCTT